MAKAGPGLAVTTGIILVRSEGYHFQDPHKAISLTVVRQVWGGQVTYSGLPKEVFVDLACHKPSYPIATDVLKVLAVDREVKNRLLSWNLASAVVRHPAQTHAQSKFSAVAALTSAVLPALTGANVKIGTFQQDLAARAAELNNAVYPIRNPGGRRARSHAVARGGDVGGRLGFGVAKRAGCGYRMDVRVLPRDADQGGPGRHQVVSSGLQVPGESIRGKRGVSVLWPTSGDEGSPME